MKKIIFCLLVVLSIASCGDKTVKKVAVDGAFSEFVSGYTSGIVSKAAPIQIVLTENFDGEIDFDKPLPSDWITFTPDAEGELRWGARNLLEFRPKNHLLSGQTYHVAFQLNKILPESKHLGDFEFNFEVIKQFVDVYIDGLAFENITDLTRQIIKGRVVCADVMDSVLLRKSFVALQDGAELPVKWGAVVGQQFYFEVGNVVRTDKDGEVKLFIKNESLGLDPVNISPVVIPALGVFKVLSMQVLHQPDQLVRISFSDPLDPKQNLKGLVSIAGSQNNNLKINGQYIDIYLKERLSGTHRVSIEEGIKNIEGKRLAVGEWMDLTFEGIKPAVKRAGNGVIIPTTGEGTLFPFDAVNLKAVDVIISRVMQKNVLQFLQVNSMSGNQELKRVAKEVFHKKIDLTKAGKSNLHTWNRFLLDISEVINVEPGAIYNIELRFRKSYSLYECADADDNELSELVSDQEQVWTEKDWQSYDYWYDYEYWDYDYDYDYRERDNPCDPSYFRNRKEVFNLLASDIGIVAKAGGDKVMHVFVNDLKSTQSISGAKVEFYDFNQELLASTSTNVHGMAELKLDVKPFVVVVTNGAQKGYLKLRDGESLSLSKFDVEGETVQRGVKGFIYGERGVWRPGDSIYLSFILEDKLNVLPQNHPVTMELFDAKGRSVNRIITSKNVSGIYDFRTATDENAVTGNYRAEVSVGNRYFVKYLKIETVKPNRLKIYLDFDGDVLTQENGNSKGKLKVKWLHGADARNLKADVNLILNSCKTKFKGFNKFTFDDPLKYFDAHEALVFDGRVDDNGFSDIPLHLNVGRNAPGMLTANFVTKVFEEGGGFSVDRKSVTYSPYSSYVGIAVPQGNLYRGTLETDINHKIDIAAIDQNGKPLNGKEVEIKVYKVSWRWWWDGYDNDLANYIASSSSVPVKTFKVTTQKGRASFDFKIDRPEWGRFFVLAKDKESGHTAGKIVYVDWPYWARSQRTSIENATMLSFSTDKEKYTTGESVKLSFPSSDVGKAIITVESGTKVLEKFLVGTQKGETKFEFATTAEMSPNVYVHVTLLQPHASTINDLPIRMYGVAPISVENPKTHLLPVIAMADEIRPETKAKIKISEQNGQPMAYTLAIVDDGLLDLTSFKTPDAWSHFYAREALGVRTWDLYDDVLGAFATDMSKLLAVGGDGSGQLKKPNKANRFKPMVRFVGPFYLKAGQQKEHLIDVPNYVGSVRVMVVAANNGSYGNAEKTVPVRSPLMVLGTLPRVLSPTEEVALPVNVFVMDNKIKDVKIKVTTNDLLALNDVAEKTVKFDKMGDKVVNFKLRVANKIGIAKAKIEVTAGNETAKYEVELDVRSPNPSVAQVVEMTVDKGQKWSNAFAFFGVQGTNALSVEISAFPSLNMDQRLKYLIRYPHGCIEQTTSSVFPQLSLEKVMELDNNYKIEIKNNIRAAIDRIKLFQTSDGGFGYWPGHTESNHWGTNYAGHFLMEAERLGYTIPSDLKSLWLGFQKQEARNYSPQNGYSNFHGYRHQNDLTQAYRLYTLALAKQPELGAMNRLREFHDLSLQAKWRLAAAYVLAGQPDVAEKLIYDVPSRVPEYKELSYTYGSEIRDEAMILETMLLLKDKAGAGALAKKLAQNLNDNHWMSTQTTAYTLLAMSKYLGTFSTSKHMKFVYEVDGIRAEEKSDRPVYKSKLKVKSSKGNFSLQNNGEGVLYVKLITEGVPVAGEETPASSGVSLSIKYKDANGNEILPNKLKQGTDFMAIVDVYNPGARGELKEMTLNQMFASGWEIHNPRMDGSLEGYGDMDYQDFRDDRVYSYYGLKGGEKKRIVVKLNATYLGRFYLPTLLTEAMYDSEINARVPGVWVEVVE